MPGHQEIVPFYWSKAGPVPLYSGRVELEYPDGSAALPGGAIMDWLPSPRIAWEGWTSSFGPSGLLLSHFLAGEPGEPTVMFPDVQSLPPSRPSRARRLKKPTYSGGGFISQQEFANGRSIHAVVCNIINGPFVDGHGSATLEKVGAFWQGRIELRSPRWHVVLDLPSDHQAIRRTLKESGGFAFTHKARIEPAAGGPFGPTEVAESLQFLAEVLSFARGALVGVALPVGVDSAGRRCWVHWSAGVSTPWRGSISWLDPIRATDLQELFLKLGTLRQDPFWADAVSQMIRYYLNANNPNPVNLAIVMAQPAFELLAWSVLKERAKRISKTRFERMSAAAKLTELLEIAGLSVTIPSSLSELQLAAAAHGWKTGPEAITRMRNTMTHPTVNNPQFTHSCWVDAWLLSQSYLELLLLRLASYRGLYMSRLPDASRWVGSSANPPWT